MGQAAELLGVQQAFLRSLDDTGGMLPARSAGGHRRYSRAQLERAGRIRELFDDGLTLDAAQRIIVLQDQLADAQRRIAELEAIGRDHTAPLASEPGEGRAHPPAIPPTPTSASSSQPRSTPRSPRGDHRREPPSSTPPTTTPGDPN